MKLNRLWICIALFAFVFSANAQEKEYTNYSVQLGLYLNGNIYSGSFTALPDVPNCCTEFSSAFALKPAFSFGFEYDFGKLLFEKKTSYILKLTYQNLSADYKENEYIGNRIRPDGFDKIYADYILEPEITNIATEHILAWNIIEDVPLDILAGVQLGFNIKTDYYQVEKLVSPKDVSFDENGSKSINESSGKIPSASAFYAALSLGLRYKAYTSSGIDFMPEIQFNYGLTKPVSSIDWSISSLRAGVTMSYRIPKSQIPPPAPPAAPPAAELKAPPVGQINLNLFVQDENNNDVSGKSISIPVSKVKSLSYYSFVPVVFFEKNSTEIKTNAKPGDNSIGTAELTDVFKVISNYIMITDISNKIKIKIMSTSDEDPNIGEKRIEAMRMKLVSLGYDRNNITFENEIVKAKFRYPELADENRSASFTLDNSGLLSVETLQSSNCTISGDAVLKIKTKYEAETFPIKFDGNVYLNNKKFADFPINGKEIRIDKNLVDCDLLDKKPIIDIQAELQDGDGQKVIRNANLTLESKTISDEKYINLDPNTNYSALFIVGYFGFDSAVLTHFDDNAKKIIAEHISKGGKVEILPMTDNLGAERYNTALAQARGKSAISKLGLSDGSYKVIINENGLFSNETPMGRMMNRSVAVKLIK